VFGCRKRGSTVYLHLSSEGGQAWGRAASDIWQGVSRIRPATRPQQTAAKIF